MLALQKRAQLPGVIGRIATLDGLDRMARQTRLRRADPPHRDDAVSRHVGDVVSSGEGEFVQPFVTGDHHGAFCAKFGQRLRVDGHIGRASDADELARHARRIGEWPHEVENGAAAQRLADRCNAGEGGVVLLRKEEADAKVRQRALRRVRCAVQIEAERFERIRSPRL